MAIIKGNESRKDIRLWVPDLNEVEPDAIKQLKNVASLPWVFHQVAVMPDVHVGKGATVGSVIAMKGALSPATVGVDIGCGMGAIRTSLKASDLPDSLEDLRAGIEARIPVSFNAHESTMLSSTLPDGLKAMGHDLFAQFGALHPGVQQLQDRAMKQVGTLGGGNHFIELCLDENETVWLMLHSGSRNIGKELAERHIEVARKLIHNAELPDRDLAVVLAGTPEMAAYRHDLMWAQQFAYLNRLVMFQIYKDVIRWNFSRKGWTVGFADAISCHHNYTSEEIHFGEEVFVTRKGAISAKQGELGIIPGSMGTKSYVVRGLGNPESFNSASHGAGRRLSRTQAKKVFTMDDFATQTAGVCCRKDAGVLDEIPGAYKNIDQVMENQKDLVEIVHTLKQVLCVKG